jgi:hypothetical protein
MARARVSEILASAVAANAWATSHVVAASFGKRRGEGVKLSWAPAELPKSGRRSRPALGGSPQHHVGVPELQSRSS